MPRLTVCIACREVNKKKAKRCLGCGKKLKHKQVKKKELMGVYRPVEAGVPPLQIDRVALVTASIPATVTADNDPVKEHKEFNTIFLDLVHPVFHFRSGIFTKLRNLVFAPGEALQVYVREKNKYKEAITYFLVFLGAYMFVNHFIFSRLDFKYQLSTQFDDYYAPLILIVLLFILATIGYITLGRRYGNSGQADYYNFKEVFVICLYIYGTNYFLAPLIIILTPYLDPLLRFLPGHPDGNILGKLTDIPLALFMLYMLFDLMKKTPGFTNLYPRYGAFLLLGYGYYFFMYDIVVVIVDKLKAL
jgi:hypothetical protein